MIGASVGSRVIASAYLADHGIPTDVVYLNHARQSPCPRSVLAAMHARQELESHAGWVEDDGFVLDARTAVADLIRASADEVAITQSATHAFNLIVNGLDWHAGDNVVVTDLAYRSMMVALLRVCHTRAIDLRVVSSHDLLLDPDDFRRVLDARTRLVLVPMIPTFCGVAQPVAAIGDVVRAVSDAHIVMNATQALGQVAIDVRALHCDFLFATSRKWLRGPRGAGVLFVRRELIPTLDCTNIGYRAATWTGPREYVVAASIDRLHAGDHSAVLFAGLHAAARHAAEVGIPEVHARDTELARYARESLGSIGGVTIHDRIHGRLGTIPITIDGQDADESVDRLQREGIVTCTIYEENNLYALRQLGVPKLVRVSLHYVNTLEDVERLTNGVQRVLDRSTRSCS